MFLYNDEICLLCLTHPMWETPKQSSGQIFNHSGSRCIAEEHHDIAGNRTCDLLVSSLLPHHFSTAIRFVFLVAVLLVLYPQTENIFILAEQADLHPQINTSCLHRPNILWSVWSCYISHTASGPKLILFYCLGSGRWSSVCRALQGERWRHTPNYKWVFKSLAQQIVSINTVAECISTFGSSQLLE